MSDKTAEQIAAEEQAAITKRVAEDKIAADKEAAVQAAKDKAAADAALISGRKRKPFIISGRPGFPFNIDGEGFGAEKKGTLSVGGQIITTTKWNDVVIKGQMPPEIKEGCSIVVTRGDGTETQIGLYKY